MQKIHKKLINQSRYYRQWHEYEYHEHHHWLLMFSAILISAGAILGAWRLTVDEIEGFNISNLMAKAQTNVQIGVLDAMSLTYIKNDIQQFPGRWSNSWSMSLAKNEYESFQMVIKPESDLSNVYITAGDLTDGAGHTISAANIIAYPVGQVEITQAMVNSINSTAAHPSPPKPGWYADPILNFTKGVDIKAGEYQSYWVTVYAPKSAAAGTYTGTLTISPAGQTLNLSVTVWDFGLEDKPHLKTALALDGSSLRDVLAVSGISLSDSLLKDYYNFLLDYRVMVTNIYGKVDDAKVAELKQNRWITPYNLDYLLLPTQYNLISGITDSEVLAQAQKSVNEANSDLPRLESMGITANDIYMYGYDELDTEYQPQMKKALQYIHDNLNSPYDENLKIFTTARIPFHIDSSWDSLVDMFCEAIGSDEMYGQFDQVLKKRAPGHEVWWYLANYPSHPNWHISSNPPIESRILMGPMTIKYQGLGDNYGPDGFLYYSIIRPAQGTEHNPHDEGVLKIMNGSYTNWEPPRFPFDNDGSFGDGEIIYAGPNGQPGPTIRLENYRDGMEDYEYYYILKQAMTAATSGKKAQVEQDLGVSLNELSKVRSQIVTDTGHYTTDPQVWYDERSLIAQAIVELGGGNLPSCACGSWQKDLNCGTNGCGSTQVYETRSCNPDGCDTGSRCVSNSSCGGTTPKCGNDACEAGETIINCSVDCTVITAMSKPDINCDCKIDIYDFGLLMSCWGGAYKPACTSGANIPASCSATSDINGDSNINVDDLGILFSYWGKDMCGGINCIASNCVAWANNQCAQSPCQNWQRLQTRTCPAGSTCSLNQCINDPVYDRPPAGSFSPAYPRIGQVTFYSTGAGPDIWNDHDMVAIRYYNSSDAQKIKAKNPDILLLAANDTLEGTVIEDRTGQPLPEAWYIHDASGKRIPFWGGYIVNLANEAPVADYIYGHQKFNEFLPRYLKENTDWNYFDASLFDTWLSALKWFVPNNDTSNIDLDYDGVADGSSMVDSRWSAGKETLITNLRNQTGKPVIPFEGGENFMNGNGFEFWTQETTASRSWNLSRSLDLLSNAVAPQFDYANSEAGLSDGDYFGPVFRADFTSAQIASNFFGHDEGTMAHRWTYLHDEYEANLGNSTTGASQIESGLWIKYFDNGVLIANISGSTKTITAGQLTGGHYYRFRGAQNPGFNNGSQFSSVTLAGVDGIMLLKQPLTLITPIVIDNRPKNMTSLGQNPASYSGSWSQVSVSSRSGYYLATGWGENSEPYAKTTNVGAAATYTPQINIAGDYEVFEWHPDTSADSQGNGCTNMSVNIYYSGNSTTKLINQTVGAGKWNSLGTYNFDATSNERVVMTAGSGCTTVSDAFRWVYRGN